MKCKVYSAIVSIIALISLSFSIFTFSQFEKIKTTYENQLKEKDKEIERLKQEKLVLIEKIRFVEEKIKEANKILKRKGIEIKIPEPKGGIFIPAEKVKISDLYFESLEKSLKKFVKVMTDIPIGLPLKGVVTSKFGYRRDPINGKAAFHSGIDIKAYYKQPIRATANGKVIFSGWKRGYGKVVIIKHKYGFETVYAHLSMKRVGINKPVKAGDIIGLAGSTGRATGVHLHYEIKRYGRYINPLELLYLNKTNSF